MGIMLAKPDQLEAVRAITVTAIEEIYPHYYPRGAVDFFLSHHHEEGILNDIRAGFVFLSLDGEGRAVGTVTLRENEICRLFVLPQYQKRGFGRELLHFAEKRISEQYPTTILDASLPAKAIYLKRGYVVIESHVIEAGSGDFLCYDVMQKRFTERE